MGTARHRYSPAEVAMNRTSQVKGPSNRKHPSRRTLTPMFHSDRMRIPRFTPDTADSVAASEMPAMSATCVTRPGSIAEQHVESRGHLARPEAQ